MKTRNIILISILTLTIAFMFMINSGCESCNENPILIHDPPLLETPEDAAEFGYDEDIQFSWGAVTNAIEYRIYIDSVEYILDPVDAVTFSSSLIDPALSIGDHTWYVEALGPNNKTTSEVRNFSIYDNIPPVIEITSVTTNNTPPITVNDTPAVNGLNSSWTLTIDGTASDEHSGIGTLEIWIDGFVEETRVDLGTTSPFQHIFRGTDDIGGTPLNDLLPNGINTVRVRVVDGSDRENDAEAYVNFMVDKQPPEIEIVDPVPQGDVQNYWGNEEFEVTVDGEDISGIASISLAVVTVGVAGDPGNWESATYDVPVDTDTMTVILPTGGTGLGSPINYVRARIEDGFGNYAYSTVTLRIDFDGTAPLFDTAQPIDIFRDGVAALDSDADPLNGTDTTDPDTTDLINIGAYEVLVRESLDITLWFDEPGSGMDAVELRVVNDESDPNTPAFSTSVEMTNTNTAGTSYEYNYNMKIYDFPNGSGGIIPDGQYWVEIVARDLAENESTPAFNNGVNETRFNIRTLVYNAPNAWNPDGTVDPDEDYNWDAQEREVLGADDIGFHQDTTPADGNVDNLPAPDFYRIELSTYYDNPPYDDVAFEQGIIETYEIDLGVETAPPYDPGDFLAGQYSWRVTSIYGNYEVVSDIEMFQVGTVLAPEIVTPDSPDWWQYVTDADFPLTFEWQYPQGETPPDTPTYNLQFMKQDKDGDWTDPPVDLLTESTETSASFEASQVDTYGYGIYLFRVQTYISGQPQPDHSAWSYRYFVVTPDGGYDTVEELFGHEGDDQIFNSPSFITKDDDGDIYVIDDLNRILVFDSAGEFVGRIGFENGPDSLTNPVALTVDSLKNVYVCDDVGPADSDLVKIYNYNSDDQIWEYDEDFPTTFNGITAITIMGGLIYVSQDSDSTTYMFDSVGNPYPDAPGQYTYAGSNDPIDLATDKQGVYLLESNGTIQKLDNTATADGGFTLSVSNAVSIEASSTNVYVVNSAGNISVYDTDGQAVTGVSFAPVNATTDVTANLDYLYALSTTSGTIEAFDAATGAIETDFGVAGVLGADGLDDPNVFHPYAIAINQINGDLYVADRDNNRILYFNSNHELVNSVDSFGGTAFNGPMCVDVVNSGSSWYNGVYVVDTGNHRLVKFTRDLNTELSSIGVEGADIGQFDSPSAVSVTDYSDNPNNDDHGRIYISDTNNNRIVVLRINATDTFYVTYTILTEDINGLTLNAPSSVYAYGGRVYVTDRSSTNLRYIRRNNNNYNQIYSLSLSSPAKYAYVDTHGALYATPPHMLMKWGFNYNPYWTEDSNDLFEIPAAGTPFLGSATAGTDVNSFNTPTGIAVFWNDDGSQCSIYVADYLNNRILRYSR